MKTVARLTIARVETVRIPPGKAEIKLWDGAVSGLCLRCFAGGGRSWVFRYRADGGGRSAAIRTLKLGNYPALSLDAARDAAKAHAGQVAKGLDPAQVRQEKRRRAQATLGTLLATDGLYARNLRDRRIVKAKDGLSCLRRGLARLMHIDVAKITRLDLVEALDALNELPGAQADLRKHTRTFLEWTTNNGLTPANVLAGMRRPQKTRAQRLEQSARRRALQDFRHRRGLARCRTRRKVRVVRAACTAHRHAAQRGRSPALGQHPARQDRVVGSGDQDGRGPRDPVDRLDATDS